MENSKVWSEENFSISLGNKSEMILTEYSSLKIPLGFNSSIPLEENYNSVIPSRINSLIPLGKNYNPTIPSRGIFLIPPRDISKITSGCSYKYTPNNYKVNLVDPEYLPIYPLMIPYMIPSIVYTNIPNNSNSKIREQIWIRIFNNKQGPKDLKWCGGNENHWRKAKDNWSVAVSVDQCDFILKSYYIPPIKLETYTCNTSNLVDGYILKILYLNIPASSNHQCRNTLEIFRKRGLKGGGFIDDRRGA